MKAHLFLATNQPIGECEVESIDQIASGVSTYLASRPMPDGYVYVECEGRTWTLTSRDPVCLEQGRLPPPEAVSAAKRDPDTAQPPSASAIVPARPTSLASRWLRLGPFLGAFLCFLLPFVDVSCRGERERLSLTGLKLSMGFNVGGQRPGEIRQIPGDKLLATAAGVVALGAVLCLGEGQMGCMLSALAGIVGLVCLFVSKSLTQKEVLGETGGLLIVDYRYGFVAVCLLLLVGVGTSTFRFIELNPPSAPPGG